MRGIERLGRVPVDVAPGIARAGRRGPVKELLVTPRVEPVELARDGSRVDRPGWIATDVPGVGRRGPQLVMLVVPLRSRGTRNRERAQGQLEVAQAPVSRLPGRVSE